MPWWPMATGEGDSRSATRICGRRPVEGLERSLEMRKLEKMASVWSRKGVKMILNSLAPAAISNTSDARRNLVKDGLLQFAHSAG